MKRNQEYFSDTCVTWLRFNLGTAYIYYVLCAQCALNLKTENLNCLLFNVQHWYSYRCFWLVVVGVTETLCATAWLSCNKELKKSVKHQCVYEDAFCFHSSCVQTSHAITICLNGNKSKRKKSASIIRKRKNKLNTYIIWKSRNSFDLPQPLHEIQRTFQW